MATNRQNLKGAEDEVSVEENLKGAEDEVSVEENLKGAEDEVSVEENLKGAEDEVSVEEETRQGEITFEPTVFTNRKRFRRLAEEIRVKCRVCKIFRQKLKELREFPIIMAAGPEDEISVEEESRQGKLNFDPTVFKNRKERFPRKAELITLKKPEWRTEDEIKYLCSLLQTLKSYRHYSRPLQLLLARVLRFERFERRRVIIKKGHVGSSFYFIYSGFVAICHDDDGISIFLDLETHLLHKGAKFGDIALIQGQKRNSTVVCMSKAEFLVVDKEDFFANNLQEQLQKEFKYRLDYFRSLDIFSHWPLEHVINIAENCQSREYSYGQLIIQDTMESESIAFIIQGTCEVMRLVKLIDCPSYRHSIQKHPKNVTRKSHELREARSVKPQSQRPQSMKPHFSDTAKLYNQKFAALKDIVELQYSKNKSLKKTEEISPLKAGNDKDTAILMQIDILREGDFLGLHETLLQDHQKDKRGLMLVSNVCEVILLKIEKFNEFCDSKTIAILEKYQKSYPSDDILCRFFLQNNDWKMFKRDFINMLVKTPKTHQAERKRTKRFQPPTSLNQTSILDLCSTFPMKQETSATSAPKGMYMSTQGRRGKPSDSKVHLVQEIDVLRPRLDRLY